MGWEKNDKGGDVYVPSKYKIDELPTWYEIHEEFLAGEWYDFNKHDPGPIDPYHKEPHRLVVMRNCCNQLNKMLNEDHLMQATVEYFNWLLDEKFQDVKNIIPSIKWIEFMMRDAGIDGSETQYITMEIITVNDKRMVFSKRHLNDQPDSPFELVIKFILKDVIEYYREPIGFKDVNGELLDGYNEIQPSEWPDPAL